MITLERILVPTDFSDYSRPVITYACELAKRFSAELQVLHVVPPPLVAGPREVVDAQSRGRAC